MRDGEEVSGVGWRKEERKGVKKTTRGDRWVYIGTPAWLASTRFRLRDECCAPVQRQRVWTGVAGRATRAILFLCQSHCLYEAGSLSWSFDIFIPENVTPELMQPLLYPPQSGSPNPHTLA